MLDTADDPIGDGAEGETAPGPRPMIVVHERRGLMSRLAVPLLLLIAAAAVLSHRFRLDHWQGFTAIFDKSPAMVPAAPPPPPIVVAAVPPPLPTVAPIPSAALTVAVPRPEPLAMNLTPMPVGPSAIPFPDRRAKVEEAWQAIRRDVEKAKEETAALEEIKRREFAEDQRLQPIREAEEQRVAVQDAKQTRLAFLNALRKAVNDKKGQPGPAVESVCSEYGMDVGGKRWAPGTMTGPEMTSTARRQRIEKLRGMGWSEPDILAELARFESRNRAARGGPRTKQDVLVRAAKQLLSVPLVARPAQSE